MIRFLIVACVVFLFASVGKADPDSDARAALALYLAQHKVEILPNLPSEVKPTGIFDYNRAWESAARNKTPFVAFVRTPAFAVAMCETAETDVLFLLLGTGVVIAVPDGNGGLKIAAELHGVQTAAQIKAAVKTATTPAESIARPRLFNLLPPPMFVPACRT